MNLISVQDHGERVIFPSTIFVPVSRYILVSSVTIISTSDVSTPQSSSSQVSYLPLDTPFTTYPFCISTLENSLQSSVSSSAISIFIMMYTSFFAQYSKLIPNIIITRKNKHIINADSIIVENWRFYLSRRLLGQTPYFFVNSPEK